MGRGKNKIVHLAVARLRGRLSLIFAASLLIVPVTILAGCDEDAGTPGETAESEMTLQTGTASQAETDSWVETASQAETEAFHGEEITEPIRDVTEAVASLSCGNVTGSCIVVGFSEDVCFIVTAAHVAETYGAKEQMDAVELNGRPVTVTDYWQSSDYDLAFLKIVREDFIDSENAEGMDELRAANTDMQGYGELKSQDEITVCGTVAGEKISVGGSVTEPWIYVEDFGYHMLYGEAENIRGGMSGGGVFDRKGRLVGMLLGSDGNGKIAVLPLAIIAGEWKHFDLAGSLDIFQD